MALIFFCNTKCVVNHVNYVLSVSVSSILPKGMNASDCSTCNVGIPLDQLAKGTFLQLLIIILRTRPLFFKSVQYTIVKSITSIQVIFSF